MKLFNPQILRTDRAGKTITDQNGNPNPAIRGEAKVVGVNNVFKTMTMRKLNLTEGQFAERFTSAAGYNSRFYDVVGADGSVTMALMSEKVIENVGREPREGQQWTTILRQRLNADGTPKKDDQGRTLMSFTIVGAPIVDMGSAFDDMLAELEGTESVANATADTSVLAEQAG